MTAQSPKTRTLIAVACLVMFIAFVTSDVLTPQRLVVAILLNVPIALSGLAFSKRLTLGLVLAALVADGISGWVNAQQEGGFDTISLANRALLAVSFILVGWMTLSLSTISSRLGVSRLEESQARRERDRERVLGAINGEPKLERALSQLAHSLTSALGARGVILASAEIEHFGSLRVAHPAELAAWPVGAKLPAKLLGSGPDGVISSEQAHELGLTANRALVSGLRWANHDPLLIAALDPNDQAVGLLEDLLPGIAAALERVELNERLETNRLELERRSGVIRDLVYAFSHDLRTPLVANGVNMRLALEGAFGPISAEYERTLTNGMQANEDVLALADTLLLVARYEGGEVRAQDQTVLLEREARAVAVRLENPIRERGLDLEWKIIEHDGPRDSVLGSASDLRRVIQNLLENAVRWSPLESTLEIRLETRAESQGSNLRLEIADRGPGVSIDLEPRLFTRFAGARAGGGSGLGLYLSKRIIESHGGRIGHHPRVGGGSVFWFELPVHEAPILSGSNSSGPNSSQPELSVRT